MHVLIEKKALFGGGANYRMTNEVLSPFIADYISLKVNVISWTFLLV